MRPSRPRHRVAGALALALAALCAGCTSGSAGAGPAGAGGNRAGGGSGPVSALPALASPGCSAATVAGPALGSARGTLTTAGGQPFGVAVTPGGHWAFTFLASGGGGAGGASVDVWRLTANHRPALLRSVPVPGQPLGAAITPDGRYLLAADGAGLVVISVPRATGGPAAAKGAVLGTLAAGSAASAPGGGTAAATAPGQAMRRAAALARFRSAIEVAVSPDGRFAFVTLEYADQAAVFNLAAALGHGFGPADYVGSIPLGVATVGLAVSPDGRWLYATSEEAVASQYVKSLHGSQGSAHGCHGVPGTVPGEPPGTLSVIGLRRAETDPAVSVVATVDAGYQPVRVVTSAGGAWVWVTARASDDLLCFSAARLAGDPARALVAVVRVGPEPVGLAAVRGGRLIVVADSDRFGASGAGSSLSVVNASAALAGRPAVLGHIPAGQFPRDMAVSPDGTLLVSDFGSGQLQAVSTAALPTHR